MIEHKMIKIHCQFEAVEYVGKEGSLDHDEFDVLVSNDGSVAQVNLPTTRKDAFGAEYPIRITTIYLDEADAAAIEMVARHSHMGECLK
jgi:hypothetical protein